MATTIIIPDSTHVEFDIPAEYIGKRIEIVYPALDDKPKRKMGDFLGILSKESGEAMKAEILKTREEWDRDI